VLTRLPIPLVSSVSRIEVRHVLPLAALLLFFLGGCSRIHHQQHDTVYVAARQMYLKDRVAAVSNRVAQVVNGQQLEVLEHGKRFLKVRTEKNEVGWIEERAVIDATDYSAFAKLTTEHKNDPVVATGSVRDDIYLHISPGRATDRFYLLPENTKVQLLSRASVPKTASNAPAPPIKRPTPAPSSAGKPAKPPTASQPDAKQASENPGEPSAADSDADESGTPSIPMEDWWLIRDPQGRTGWLLGGRVDVDVPDEIGQYAEGQRIVGAYVIAKVNDSEANVPNNQVSEYVTALSPPKSGLPFDFDQIRVFTWSVKHHRYETAFRLRPIQGYFPLRITSQPGPSGTEPVFSFLISSSANVSIDPDTGIAHPLNPRTISYSMRDTAVRRTGSDMAPIPTSHLPGVKPKSGKPQKKRK